MNELGKLQREATEACERRGHHMHHWTSLTDHSAVSNCWNCKMEAHVNTKPAPNRVDISGEAVALNCKEGY